MGLIVAGGCCCGPRMIVGSPCGYCSTATPGAFDLLLSGVVLCQCAPNYNDTVWSSFRYGSGDLNGVYRLDQGYNDGFPCHWGLPVEVDIYRDLYRDPACTSLIQTQHGTAGYLNFWRRETGWEFTVGVDFAATRHVFFRGLVDEAEAGDCLSVLTILNDDAEGDCRVGWLDGGSVGPCGHSGGVSLHYTTY